MVAGDHIFARLAALTGAEADRPFLTLHRQGRRESHSYGDLLRRSAQYAAAIGRSRRPAGSVVLIMLEHGFDLYAAFVGAVMAGAAPSIMPVSTRKQDPRLFWPAHRTLFGLIDPTLIIATAEAGARLGELVFEPGRAWPLLLAEEVAEAGAAAPDWRPGEVPGVAFLQHSSGTTALKKGVALGHAAVNAQLDAYEAAIGYAEGDVIASWLPLYHDMGLITSFLLPVSRLRPVAAIDAFEWVARPHALFEVMEQSGAAYTWLPNFSFDHLVRTDDPARIYRLGRVKAFVNCSEPCKAASMDRFARQFARHGIRRDQLQVCYAMAETVFAATQTAPGTVQQPVEAAVAAIGAGGRDFPLRGTVSCGRPIDGVEIVIADTHGHPLPDGEVGEICIRAPFLFTGYYKREAETREALADGFYRSGDLGLTVRGELFVVGRKKDLIIVHGKNLVGHEIEEALAGREGIRPGRVVAFGLYNERVGSEDLVILFEPQGEMELARLKALQNEIKEQVFSISGVYPQIVRTVPQGWLVKTTSGKIGREANRQKFLDERGVPGAAS